MDYDHLKELLHQPLWAYYVSVMLVMAPTVRIVSRTGLKPWAALLLLIPYVGYMFCAAWLAFQKWPRLASKGAKS